MGSTRVRVKKKERRMTDNIIIFPKVKEELTYDELYEKQRKEIEEQREEILKQREEILKSLK